MVLIVLYILYMRPTLMEKMMLAYHNDPELKKSVVAQMAAHRKADELVKGVYWEDGKGCAVGCLIKGGNHALYETKFGIPRQLAYLEDRIFENLDNGASQKWPERFLKAIKPGADLSMVVPKLMLCLLEDPDGIRKFARPDGLAAIEKIAVLYRKKINGENPTQKEWLDARDDAYKARRSADAYAYAAYAAGAYAAGAYAADAYAAYAYAADAADAAAAAAYAADAYAAYAADAAAADAYAAYAYAADAYAAAAYAAGACAAYARQKFWVRVADQLIELLKGAA